MCCTKTPVLRLSGQLKTADKTYREDIISERYTGGCLCGAVRYEFSQAPKQVTICHCNDCKKVTGSVFGLSMEIEAASFTILSGQLKKYTKTADNGIRISRAFCSNCGSPVLTTEETYPDLVWIKAGSLDEPELVKPTKQIWTKRAVPWAKIDAGLLSFSEEGK